MKRRLLRSRKLLRKLSGGGEELRSIHSPASSTGVGPVADRRLRESPRRDTPSCGKPPACRLSKIDRSRRMEGPGRCLPSDLRNRRCRTWRHGTARGASAGCVSMNVSDLTIATTFLWCRLVLSLPKQVHQGPGNSGPAELAHQFLGLAERVE